MKKTLPLLLAVIVFLTSCNSQPQAAVETPSTRGSQDFKIGVAGYTYREFSIEQTLEYLKSLDVKYFSVKDWWLPLDATAGQMEQFKAKCAEYGIEGYILGPIYMHSEEEVDRTFDYAARYGAPMFIGVPDYALIDRFGFDNFRTFQKTV